MCGGVGVGVGARRRIALPDPGTCIRGHGGFGRREGVPERSAEMGVGEPRAASQNEAETKKG